MFTKKTFTFLDELAASNNRPWFEENKLRYEALVQKPALEYVEAMGSVLEQFAPHFRAVSRKVGGSLMRVYRDTRFSRNKAPYKTNIGIHFRHALGKDIHAPGFYVHIASEECFLAIGCWHPDAVVLGKVRDYIVNKPEKWFSARNEKRFVSAWSLSGERLTRPPRGYAASHPAIEDIKRKDFVAIAPLAVANVTGPRLISISGKRFAETVPFMKFLCDAIDVPY